MRIFKTVITTTLAICFISGLFAQKERNGEIAGRIGSKTYTYEEYNSILNNYYQYWQKQGVKLTDDKKKELNNQCWEELVARQIYDEEIMKRKINPSDDELYNHTLKNPPQAVKSIKDLQTNNKFDKNKFKIAMEKTPEFKKNVLDVVRDQYRYDKLFSSIKAGAKVNTDSIYREWKKANNKADGKVISFDLKPSGNLAVESEEIEKYYKENYETFKRDPIRKYRYIKISNSPSSQDSINAQTKADSLYHILTHGGDFEKIAQKHSQDPGSGQKGGDLGYFGKGRMVPEFEKTCWDTPVGEIAKPVKTRFGWHIIKIFDRKTNEQGQEEVKASHILIKFEPGIETIENNKRLTQQAFDLTKEKGIRVAGDQLGLTVQETEEFKEKDRYTPGLGAVPELFKFAFENPVGTVHDIYTGRNNEKFILQISDSLGVHYASLEKEKENIIRLIQRKKKVNAQYDYAQKFIQSYPPEDYLKIAEKDSLTIVEFKDLTENSTFTKLGSIPELTTAILSKAKGQFTDLLLNEKGVYLAYVSNRQYANDKTWQKEKNKEIKKVRDQLQNNQLNKWYANQKQKIKVEDNRKKYYKL